jgi:hypothetical protein
VRARHLTLHNDLFEDQNDPELDWNKTLANFDLLVMWVVNKPDWSRI